MGCGGSKADDDDTANAGDVNVTIVGEKKPKKLTAAERAAEEKAVAEAKAAAEAAEANAKLEADAASKLQAIARGKTDRAKVELMKHPCDEYRVNMKSETFGTTCICGWAKSEHAPEVRPAPSRLPSVLHC